MKLLKDKTDVALVQRSALLRFKLMHWLFLEIVFSFPRVIVEADNAEQRRFTGTAWPHDGHEFALVDLKRDLAQDICRAGACREAFFDVAKLNHFFRQLAVLSVVSWQL